MLIDLCNLIWKLKPEQTTALLLFIQVDYLHDKVLNIDKRKHVTYLAEKIIEIKGKPEKLDQAIQGSARFERSKTFAVKTLYTFYHQFMIWEQIKKGNALKLETIKYYEALDPKIALKLTEKLTHDLTQKSKKNVNEYELYADLLEQQYFNPISPKPVLGEALELGIQQISIGYLIRLLRMELELLLHKQMFSQSELTAKPSLILHLEALIHIFSHQHPAILLYYQLIGLVHSPGISALDKTLGLLKTSVAHLHLDDISIIGNNLHTLINQEYEKTGDIAIQKRMFDLYKLFYHHPEIFQSYLAEPIFLSNVAAVSANVGEGIWMSKVIDQLAPTLPQGEKNIVIILAKIKLYLFERKFIEAEEILLNLSIFNLEPRIKISYYICNIMLDLIRACDGLIPLVRSRYKPEPWLMIVKKNVTNLDTKLGAFVRALREDDTFQGTRVQSYKNFIKVVREIKNSLSKKEMDEETFERLHHITSTYSPLASKGWLLSLIRTQASRGYPGN
jgi:hypothetical protein